MSDKKRPDTRIVLKPSGGGQTITLASFWTDGERPSGGLDKRIRKIRVLLDDGTDFLVDNTQGAKSHFCNLYVDKGEERPAPRGNGGGSRWPDETARKGDADNFDDDLPF